MPSYEKRMHLGISFLLLLIVFLLVFGLYWCLMRREGITSLYPIIHVEYGKKVTSEDIALLKDLENYTLTPSLDTLNDIGEYIITIQTETYTTKVKLIVEDTQAPIVEVQDLTIYIDEELPSKEAFFKRIEEQSNYTILDYHVTKELGDHVIDLTIYDEFGNITEKQATLTILEDTEPPVFQGLSVLTIELGDSLDLYSGVSAIDARFGNVTFTVDDSTIDYNRTGSYTVTYQASDNLGNATTASRTVVIKAKEVVYQIHNFPTYHQYPNYPNGCESIALYTLLSYYNVNVTPEQIVEKLAKGASPYWQNNTLYGGNPELEFVGDPRLYNGYGVYQKPIMAVANTFKSGMIDYTGHSLDEVLNNLVKQQIPVQVWVSINLRNTSVCASWIYPVTGETINWLCDLHSVVIVGFSNSSVIVSDPYTGQIETYNRTQFEKVYNLFGRRALYYNE